MKVSIITATYNSQSTIEEAILSVATQSYSNIEHIIIDGNSTDKTLEIINKNKSKISKCISETDSGIYEALNKGLKLATGDIIGFLHSDDIFENEHVIEKIVETFLLQQCEAVYGNLLYINKNNNNKIIRKWKAGNFKTSKLKFGWMPPHPTLFMHKNIYNSIGNFNTKYTISADYDLILRVFLKTKIKCIYLNEVLIRMKVGGKSNKGAKNIITKTKEDVEIAASYKFSIFTIILKNLRKIHQLF